MVSRQAEDPLNEKDPSNSNYDFDLPLCDLSTRVHVLVLTRLSQNWESLFKFENVSLIEGKEMGILEYVKAEDMVDSAVIAEGDQAT
ncbi:hypothetical protein L1987_85884 [Smallanthus sonchifolius]|uniref:Uncharacterized protein n=1 Tax=Smallanthus sonchifolius TaxID=185202 RepID=A0ACB8XZC7_9ASTR|nr:hypothetical protein L1987_85884 [Smallanthus sonchifolius]